MKIVVFDLGGTLMQYVGMPHSWVDFYEQGLEAIRKKYGCNVSEEEIEQTLQILRDFNPRVNYREVEYKAEQIFAKALEHWNLEVPFAECMEVFWSGLNLTAEIYPETVEVLQTLKEEGYVIATLTDLPSAMPDEVFQKDITDLLGYFDFYVSSAIAGYRKPNVKGLQMIAEHFGVPVTELIFVGDEEKDRQAAVNANCRFVHISRTQKAVESISDLFELTDILQGQKSDLLFYDAYEAFYQMAGESEAFRLFCKEAFGEDFSQDGFSDLAQIERILQYIPEKEDVHILDVGCGNGKMLGYLQRKTNAYIHGFDYSAEAIKTAQALFTERAEFREGIIGEIEYPKESFDVVVSMDTMYFAKDMIAFVAQVKRWLKPGGVFFVGYQEGDVVPKTENAHTSLLAEALNRNGLHYEVTDITEETYELLKTKREAALKYQQAFEKEGHEEWFEMLIGQTDCTTDAFEAFKEKMARYLYVVRK